MYKKDTGCITTTPSTLNPVFKKPIRVNIRGGSVTFYIREGQAPSDQMIKVMKIHKAPIPPPTM